MKTSWLKTRKGVVFFFFLAIYYYWAGYLSRGGVFWLHLVCEYWDGVALLLRLLSL